MKRLQEEHKAWVEEKYPGQPPKVPAVGCLEEAGELVHAILKIEQVRVWGEDARHKLPALRMKLTDAVGDCGIYACSLCDANGWNFEELWTEAADCRDVEWPSDPLDAAIVLVQRASDVALQPEEPHQLFVYLCQLTSIARMLGLDAEAAVKTTWEVVKCR